MKTENWKKVKELLDEVLPLDAKAREKFLDGAGVGAEIRREVESLLTFEKSVEDFMSITASGYGKDFFDAGERSGISLVGQRVGVYEITGELGQGGMGAVYLAARTDGKFKQKVAIKMLRREFNTEKFRRNFNREKEILATLAHPNIARLLDAGTSVDGVPFLAMEYIEGVPIDKFCGENRLSLTARLKLFNRVCDAVAYAHRNLIVHRDLKPSNILVTADGEPKLLDFGISKLLVAETENEQTLTNFGAMTPQYASPEQIKGETVTTASDVYSLGVVLFKMLTGKLPYDLSEKTNGKIIKEISEVKLPLPSRILQSEEKRIGAEVAKTKSANRQPFSQLPFSASRLKGDLDNIVLKSLRKNPERRYKTVEQFSADIWRFIDGLPVAARPATVGYRALKFYARNKISVLAGFLIFLSLVAGIAVAVSQARAALNQAQIASEARLQAELVTEKANAEKEKSEKISRFMAKIISYANPAWYAEGSKFAGGARVIDALEDLSGKIDAEFAGQADVAAELHHKFSEVFLMASKNKTGAELEKFEERRKFHALRALELRRQFYGERHELVAKDLFYAYWFLGKNDGEYAALLMQAIEMMRETNPKNLNLPYMLEAYTARLVLPDVEDRHETYRQAVLPPTTENKYQIAERFLLESLPLFREHYKPDNQAIIAAECKLAYVQLMQNKQDEAAPHQRICREGAAKLQSENLEKFLSLVEPAKPQNNR